MKQSRIFVLAIAALMGISSFLASKTQACTTAVLSGRFTASGRPMIWKLRDTEAYANHIRRFEGAKGYFVGLVNDEDTAGDAVWGGHNACGFAIMNSASFNVNQNDTSSIADCEGTFMKRALSECATLADFEALLNSLPKPMGLASHFGVIDAEGGAAFYEVNNYTWTKFDAAEAPEGYIIRTNYSFTGTKDVGYGYVRFRTASELFAAVPAGAMTSLLLGGDISRSMLNSQTKTDYRALAKRGDNPSEFIDSDDLISRYDTASMILVEGVKKGEDPALTTSWVQVGNPHICPLLPVWTWQEVPATLARPDAKEVAWHLLKTASDARPVANEAALNRQNADADACTAPVLTQKAAAPAKPCTAARGTVAQKALLLKKRLYPLTTVEETRYLYLPLVVRPDGEGLSQRYYRLESGFVPAISASADRAERARLQNELINKSLALMDDALERERDGFDGIRR